MEEITAREQIFKAIREAQVLGKTEYCANDASVETQLLDCDCSDPIGADLSLALTFAKNFDTTSGYFIYCNDNQELANSIKTVIQEQKITSIFTQNPKIELFFSQEGIIYNDDGNPEEPYHAIVTFCDALVAAHGNILFTTETWKGGLAGKQPVVRFIIAFRRQLVATQNEALKILSEKYEDGDIPSFTFIGGTSCYHTIDYKKIIGLHGNKELYVFFLNQ